MIPYRLYRMKRFPTYRQYGQRIHITEWDKELAQTDYHDSEFYIKIEVMDQILQREVRRWLAVLQTSWSP